MKRIRTPGLIAILILLALSLTACGSRLEVTESTGKKMVLTAKNASKDGFILANSLDVEEGEQIVLSAALTKGEIRVRILSNEEEQSIDVLPVYGGDPIISADLHGTDGMSGTVPAGNYAVQATCLERATGTVEITVAPAS